MKKWFKIFSFISIVIAMFGLLGAKPLGGMHGKKTTTSAQSTLVKLSTVTVQSVPETVTAMALLAAKDQATLMANASGYIKELTLAEGQFVKQGTSLVVLNSNTQAQAYAADQAETALAHATMLRNQQLLQQNMVAKQDMDQYLSAYRKALAKEAADKALLNEMTLRTPISGYLGATNFHVGDYVTPGNAVVTITDTRQLKVIYSLPSRFAARLALGQQVELTTDSFPEKKFVGKVSFINPTVDQTTQTIEVHAMLDNQAGILRPGEAVLATHYLGITPNAILVPSEAIFTNVNGSYVLQVKDNVVVSTPVVIGNTGHTMTVVKQGLTENSQVISTGQFQVQAGQHVQIVK